MCAAVGGHESGAKAGATGEVEGEAPAGEEHSRSGGRRSWWHSVNEAKSLCLPCVPH